MAGTHARMTIADADRADTARAPRSEWSARCLPPARRAIERAAAPCPDRSRRSLRRLGPVRVGILGPVGEPLPFRVRIDRIRRRGRVPVQERLGRRSAPRSSAGAADVLEGNGPFNATFVGRASSKARGYALAAGTPLETTAIARQQARMSAQHISTGAFRSSAPTLSPAALSSRQTRIGRRSPMRHESARTGAAYPSWRIAASSGSGRFRG